jgi:sulfite reductase (NADPH) hemoprotein beta-component
MYVYDTFDQTLINQRVNEFRDQVKRRLSGELTEEQFRPLRLMNGLYLQLHAYMLRVAIPYGTLSSEQMRALAHVARTYDRGYGHFTTRQNIQYNWIRLEDAPDLLYDLAAAQMYGIQTSGNCIRNVTADQFAGATAEEVDDPRIYSELIRQWSTLHPEFSFLPRKFKIAVTGAEHDRAAVRFHDIGLIISRGDAGEIGFEVIAGGGMGRTPVVGPTIREFLPKQHLQSYLEAILRVYNRYGRRDNIYKARIKILVRELGAEKFTEEVEAEWAAIDKANVDHEPSEEQRVREMFVPPAFAKVSGGVGKKADQSPEFKNWYRTNVHAHKQPGYGIVTISLKPIGGIPGDASAEQMDLVADLAERYSFGEVRVTHEQNLVLPHIAETDLFALWEALASADLATPNAGLITDIIACPGLDYCSLANARSIPVSQRISERFRDLQRQHDIGDLKVKISGCINACGHHHAGHIGILGVDRKGQEFYQITLGGSGAEDAAIGQIIGPGFSYDDIVDAVETIVQVYIELRQEGETFLSFYRRVGGEPFKERLYARV